MADPIPGDNQVSTDFMAGRALAQRGADDEVFQRLLGGAPKAKPAPAEGATAGATEGVAAARQAPQGQPEAPDEFAALAGGMPAPIGASILHGTYAAAKDIAKGALDLPRQVAGGALDFYNNLGKFADDVQRAIVDKTGIGGAVTFQDKQGNWAPRLWSGEEWQKAVDSGEAHELGASVPTTGEPDTVTGNVIRTGTTFLLGRGRLAAGGGVAANLGADFAGGALMDPSQPRLSNIVDQVAPNFVTDFLKAKPGEEDPLLGRLKAGLEYAGLGAAFEGVKRSVGALKEALGGEAAGSHPLLQPGGTQAPVTAPSAGEAAPQAAQAVATPRDYLPIGNPLEPAIKAPPVTPEIQSQAMDYLSGKTGENPVKINLARVGSSDDIKQILSQVSTYIPKTGPISHEETQMTADALGLRAEDFLARNVGSGMSREELLAGRMALDSAASTFGDYAKRALDPATASPDAKAQAVKAFGTLRAMSQYMENARSEAGRTLDSLKILSQSRSYYTQAFQKLLDEPAGDFNKLLERAVDLQNPTKISAFVAQSTRMTGRDAFVYGWNNILLSNPKTIVKKLGSDAGMGLWNVMTRYAAERFGSGAVAPGEAAQLGYGYVSSLKDGIRAAGRALQAGESQFWRADSTIEQMGAAAKISALANGATPITEGQPTRAALEYLKSAMPTSWIGAADDFAKTVNYRAELRSLAYRDATTKGVADIGNHIDGIMAAPPMNLHEMARSAALRNTFQEPLTGLAQIIQQGVDRANIPLAHTNFELPVGRILMPFVKVPTNIAAWSYRNSPMAAAFPNSVIRQELNAGGAARDIAIAKMTLGSAVSLGLADLAYNNVMTGRGPSDPQLHRAWLEAGNKPYSLRVGGNWYSYNQIEPFGLMAGAISDTFNTMRFARDRDMDQLAPALAFGVGNAMMSKTYMSGLAAMFDALEHPDQDSKVYADRLLSSFAVPAGVRGLSEAFDPWARAHYGLLDTIESNTPFVRNGLPLQTTLWGDPIPPHEGFMPLVSGTGLARMLSPISYAPADNAEPVDKWIWENRKFFNPDEDDNGRLGLSKLGPHVTYTTGALQSSVELTPEALYRYQRLAGQELKDPISGMGAKDTLNALVQGTYAGALQDQWNRASPAAQAMMLKSIVYKYRAAAKQQLLNEFPDIKEAIEANWTQRAQQLQGAR